MLNHNPLLILLAGLAVGIIIAEKLFDKLPFLPEMLIAVAAMGVVATMVLSVSRAETFRLMVFRVIFFLAVAAVGGWRLMTERKVIETDWEKGIACYKVRIIDLPKHSEKTTRVDAEVVSGRHCRQTVRLYLRDGLGLHTADELWVQTRVERPRNNGNPEEFDYASYLRRQGIAGTGYCFQWKCMGQSTSPSFLLQVRKWQEKLLQRYEIYFKGKELSVLAAMTLGDKRGLQTETRDIFSRTGTSHLLALSGLHIGILFTVYQWIVFAFIRQRSWQRVMGVVAVIGLWLFTFMVGAPLSLIRSVVMFSLLQGGILLRGEHLSLNNLSLAAILILLVSPQALFDVGFQLSFLSVFFILTLARRVPCPNFLQRNKIGKAIYSLLAVSLAAQVGTAPLVAYYFNTLPLYGWLANLVVVPFAYVLLFAALLFFLLPFAQSVLAIAIARLLEWMLSWLENVAALPAAAIECFPSKFTIVVLYLLLWMLVVVHWRRNRLLLCAGFILLLCGGVEMYLYRVNKISPQIVFYHHRRQAAVHCLLSSEKSYLWTSEIGEGTDALAGVRKTFWRKYRFASPSFLHKEYRDSFICFTHEILLFGGRRIALLQERIRKNAPIVPLKVDYALLVRGFRGSVRELLLWYRPKVLILDATLSDYHRARLLSEAREVNLSVYDMAVQGALTVSLQK